MLKKMIFLLVSLLISFQLAACSEVETTNLTNEGPGKERIEQTSEVLDGDYFSLLQQASEEYLKNTELESILPHELYKKMIIDSDEQFIVVDVRDTESFANGNIEGSINIPYVNTADLNQIENLPKDKTIYVICFSGHTASQTAALWNMLGYHAVPIEYGIGGWSSVDGLGPAPIKQPFEFDVHTGKSVVDGKINDLPTISIDKVSTIEQIIINQSKEYLNSGKGAVIQPPVVNEKTIANDPDLFLVDVRSAKHYEKGHVKNSINIPIATLASIENLKKLPADKQIVVIGYHAVDGSIANRVLNQLGYNAITLNSGMRAWTSNTDITGTIPIPVNLLNKYPVKILNYNLKGDDAQASCS